MTSLHFFSCTLLGKVHDHLVTTSTIPKPRLSSALKKLGAVDVKRTGPSTFNIGFKLVGDDCSAPGNGLAIAAELRKTYGEAAVKWRGSQAYAINLNLSH